MRLGAAKRPAPGCHVLEVGDHDRSELVRVDQFWVRCARVAKWQLPSPIVCQFRIISERTFSAVRAFCQATGSCVSRSCCHTKRGINTYMCWKVHKYIYVLYCTCCTSVG